MNPFPNTFIIGVQKAGTTTLDDWLHQHPQVYGYETLKDVHLFARYKNRSEIEACLQQEPTAYKGEPIVLQSAVNYVFYPSMLQQIAQYAPDAKLILILRHPVQRALSAYGYFTKMLREKRLAKEALMYQPQTGFSFSKDNNDLTYIEHGMYAKQVRECFKNFSQSQLLVLDYDELKNPAQLLYKTFSFLSIDTAFKPDLTIKNITGSVRSEVLQKTIIGQSKLKQFFIKHFINPWLPVTKRKKLKAKLFQMNTGKTSDDMTGADISEIKNHLRSCFLEDTKELDALLQTHFYEKWFLNFRNNPSSPATSAHA